MLITRWSFLWYLSEAKACEAEHTDSAYCKHLAQPQHSQKMSRCWKWHKQCMGRRALFNHAIPLQRWRNTDCYWIAGFEAGRGMAFNFFAWQERGELRPHVLPLCTPLLEGGQLDRAPFRFRNDVEPEAGNETSKSWIIVRYAKYIYNTKPHNTTISTVSINKYSMVSGCIWWLPAPKPNARTAAPWGQSNLMDRSAVSTTPAALETCIVFPSAAWASLKSSHCRGWHP